MRLALVLAVSLLSGCAHWFGPAHGIVYVVGDAPGNSDCLLAVAPADSPGATDIRMVAGTFREGFTVQPSSSGHRAQLTCQDVVVASRGFKYGRDVSIGGDLPIAAGDP